MKYTEIRCTPKLSKFLKGKGCDLFDYCDALYHSFDSDNQEAKSITEYYHSEAKHLYYQAPTHQMVLDYIRNKNMLISVVWGCGVDFMHPGYIYEFYDIINNKRVYSSDCSYEDYKDCTESAIYHYFNHFYKYYE